MSRHSLDVFSAIAVYAGLNESNHGRAHRAVATPKGETHRDHPTPYLHREVLVVDADADVGTFIAEVLSYEGYGVRVVGDTHNAHSDLVLCDFFLLGRSAADFMMTLRRDGFAHIPIVLTTTDVWAAKRLDVPGIAFCLIKPFNLDELLECVAAHVRPYTSDLVAPDCRHN